jgi:hypothetical protein
LTFNTVHAEAFGGHQQLRHEILSSFKIDKKDKWNFFNFSTFGVDYRSRTQFDMQVYSSVTYNLTKNWGIAAGGYVSNFGFVPIAAISWQYTSQNGDLFVNLFPTVELTRKPNYEMFGLAIYSPKISENWRFFSQLTVLSNFNFRQHNISMQQLRIGLQYAGFQFGAGTDFQTLTLPTPDGSGLQNRFSPNIGVFVRKTFEF